MIYKTIAYHFGRTWQSLHIAIAKRQNTIIRFSILTSAYVGAASYYGKRKGGRISGIRVGIGLWFLVTLAASLFGFS